MNETLRVDVRESTAAVLSPHFESKQVKDSVRIRVAGIHYENRSETAAKLNIYQRVELVREPDNAYDPKAIKVQTEDGEMIGYIPKEYNYNLAPWIDKNSTKDIESIVVVLDTSGFVSDTIGVMIKLEYPTPPLGPKIGGSGTYMREHVWEDSIYPQLVVTKDEDFDNRIHKPLKHCPDMSLVLELMQKEIKEPAVTVQDINTWQLSPQEAFGLAYKNLQSISYYANLNPFHDANSKDTMIVAHNCQKGLASVRFTVRSARQQMARMLQRPICYFTPIGPGNLTAFVLEAAGTVLTAVTPPEYLSEPKHFVFAVHRDSGDYLPARYQLKHVGPNKQPVITLTNPFNGNTHSISMYEEIPWNGTRSDEFVEPMFN